MLISTSLTSNVGIPVFTPSNDTASLVAFDNKDRLNVQGYNDDTVVPIASGPATAYYRW